MTINKEMNLKLVLIIKITIIFFFNVCVPKSLR